MPTECSVLKRNKRDMFPTVFKPFSRSQESWKATLMFLSLVKVSSKKTNTMPSADSVLMATIRLLMRRFLTTPSSCAEHHLLTPKTTSQYRSVFPLENKTTNLGHSICTGTDTTSNRIWVTLAPTKSTCARRQRSMCILRAVTLSTSRSLQEFKAHQDTMELGALAALSDSSAPVWECIWIRLLCFVFRLTFQELQMTTLLTQWEWLSLSTDRTLWKIHQAPKWPLRAPEEQPALLCIWSPRFW